MDEAWGRACSTTYSLPNCTSGRRNNAAERNVDGLRLWIEVGAQTATTQTERGRSEAMMAAHAAEIAGQRQHRMVTKGDANGNGPQSRSDAKGLSRHRSRYSIDHSRRVVTAGDAASGHDRIRVPAAAHDMDEAWGRACSTTYSLPYCKSGRRKNAEWNVDGLRL